MKRIIVNEETIIPGTDIVLEEGDTIIVLREGYNDTDPYGDDFFAPDFGLPEVDGHFINDMTNPDSKGYSSLELFDSQGRRQYPIMVSETFRTKYSNRLKRAIFEFLEEHYF